MLVWWGHERHGKISDDHVKRIVDRVKNGGMGFIALHSAHYSKALKALLGTNCGWKGGYVEDGSKLDLIVKDKQHPIVAGVSDFSIPHTERYSEAFEIPEPEAVVLDGVYIRPDGSKESSRQGLVWTVGKGRVFYFQPGHETYPYSSTPTSARSWPTPWSGPAAPSSRPYSSRSAYALVPTPTMGTWCPVGTHWMAAPRPRYSLVTTPTMGTWCMGPVTLT